MPVIAWGEADVRDAMSYFDPAAADYETGLWGKRAGVVAVVFWVPCPAGGEGRSRVYGVRGPGRPPWEDDEDDAEFLDPVEAIAYALDLVRKEQA